MSQDWRRRFDDVREGLASYPGKSATSLLAIAAGVMMVTLLLSCLEGLQRQGEAVIRTLGVNVIAVLAEDSSAPGVRQPLGNEQVQQLRAALPDAEVSALRRDVVPTVNTDRRVTLVSTDERLAHVRGWPLVAGRFLDARDLKLAERNVVISASLARAWGWRVGQTVLLGNSAFTVIGLVALDSGGPSVVATDSRVDYGELVAFAARTVPPPWGHDERPPDSPVDAVFIRAASAQALAATLSRARNLLNPPGARPVAATFVTPQALAVRVDHLRATIAATAGAAALLCLLLGAITSASVMLANVRERLGEIGLRRALGAGPADITALFLSEAAAVSVLAGLLGMVLGHVLIAALAGGSPLPLAVSAGTVFAPMAVGLLCGVAAAYYPARKAALIPPALALRAAG